MTENLLAVAGVLCILIALVALAGPWWALGALGAVLLVAAWAAHTHTATEAPADRSEQP